MVKKIIVLIILFLLPLIAKAEGMGVVTKLEKWQESFEKQNIELVIINKDYFSLTEEEINFLFNSESKKFKNPLAKDFKITLSGNFFKFQAVFNRILKGKIYFEAQPLENKVGIKVLKAKYYGFKVPSKWVEKALNKEIDKYFNFLYQSDKYQGAKLAIKGKIVKLWLEFKEI
jgi:hypothetical protein